MAKESAGGFRFSIPPLPRDWYDWLKRVQAEYGCTQYDLVMGGLRALDRLRQADPYAAKHLVIGTGPSSE